MMASKPFRVRSSSGVPSISATGTHEYGYKQEMHQIMGCA